MGHLVGKDLYRKLGKKIDGLTLRAPWNEALYAILKELYSEDEARLVLEMPYGLSTIARLEKVTKRPRAELQALLERMCPRGLVLDLVVNDHAYYAPSPFVIGVFEFTMMRTGEGLEYAKWAKMFKDYFADGEFYEANSGDGQKVSLMRVLPWESGIVPDEHVEVLDYEKASAIIDEHERFAIGICSCRHEKHHLGEKECKAPLETCSTFGAVPVAYMVRNGFAREVSKSEMKENLARSRELGLIINADNVQRNVTFMCHCCGCCCNVLQGITKHGYPNVVVTSNWIAASDREKCKGCGICSRRCPIEAIPRVADPDPRFKKHGRPRVDEAVCVGCGVCTIKCKSGAMKLHPRKQRVLHPETTFERTILQCLERGTLQNQLFDDPSSKGQAFLRGLVGGFLRLSPVKRSLMSDALRSRFLNAMKKGATKQGKGELVEL